MNKKIIAGIGAVLIIGGIYISMPKNETNVEATEGLSDSENIEIQKNQEAKPVVVELASKKSISNKIYAIGEIAPETIYEVNAKSMGKVESVYFDLGDKVKKGDILFQMDTETFDINKNATINQKSNALESAKLSYNQAKEKYENEQALYEKGLVSKLDFDNSKKTLEKSELEYQNAKTAYNSQISTFGDKLKDYLVKSPIDGIIIGKTISKDQYASTQNGFKLMKEGNLKIDSSITSKYIQKISPEQEVDINLKTQEQTYKGKVKNVSYSAEKGLYPIEIEIEGAGNGKALPGMYAELEIHLEKKEAALTIPFKAVINDGKETYVYAVDESNIANKKIVELGIKENDIIEVKKGIKEGEKVITIGKEYLVQGDLVADNQ